MVARGRDYTDVSPIDGIVSSSGPQKLKVEVDVIPDGEAMPESAGEPGNRNSLISSVVPRDP